MAPSELCQGAEALAGEAVDEEPEVVRTRVPERSSTDSAMERSIVSDPEDPAELRPQLVEVALDAAPGGWVEVLGAHAGTSVGWEPLSTPPEWCGKRTSAADAATCG
jgi:hypothetical protein